MVKQLMSTLSEFLKEDDGQGTVEYILIIAMVVIAIMVALAFFRNQIRSLLSRIIDFVSAETDAVEDAPAPD